MANLFLDPVSFFRSANGFRLGIAVLVLVAIQTTGIASLVVKMAFFVPDEDLSVPVVGYMVGLGMSTLITAMFSLLVAFAVFWVLSWFCRDGIPLHKLLLTFCYALIPGQFATLVVRSLLIIFSSGSTPLSTITNATSMAAFVENPPTYLTVLDPFLFWSVVLLALGYTELTGGKRSRWFSLGISLVPLVLSRMI